MPDRRKKRQELRKREKKSNDILERKGSLSKKLKDDRWKMEMEMNGTLLYNKRKITVGDQDQNLTKTASTKMVLTDTANQESR